jgi:hypothetical protein
MIDDILGEREEGSLSDWQITVALVLGGAAVGLLYNISAKVEAMSRLLHKRALEDFESGSKR